MSIRTAPYNAASAVNRVRSALLQDRRGDGRITEFFKANGGICIKIEAGNGEPLPADIQEKLTAEIVVPTGCAKGCGKYQKLGVPPPSQAGKKVRDKERSAAARAEAKAKALQEAVAKEVAKCLKGGEE